MYSKLGKGINPWRINLLNPPIIPITEKKQQQNVVAQTFTEKVQFGLPLSFNKNTALYSHTGNQNPYSIRTWFKLANIQLVRFGEYPIEL